jgi:hypothetical protein
VAPRRSRRSPSKHGTLDPEPQTGIEGAPLEPIAVVERELTRPDGTKLRVEVPVYPPFRLAERPPPKAEPRKQKPPQKKAS